MAASALVFGEDGEVRGVVAGEFGLDKIAGPGRATSPAWSCTASTCCSPRACAARSRSRLIARYGLAEGREPQKYGLGMKEIWEVRPEAHGSGR